MQSMYAIYILLHAFRMDRRPAVQGQESKAMQARIVGCLIGIVYVFAFFAICAIALQV